MAINAISVREGTLSGQLPSDKELASEGPEARQGARPEVCYSLSRYIDGLAPQPLLNARFGVPDD